MTFQIVLIIGLGMMTLLLIYLIVTRLRAERRFQATLRLISSEKLIELLQTNSVDGKIHIVASRVSELLKSSFGCQKIVFLRKQRGILELNYFHGVFRFNRADFRIPYSRQLGDRLRQTYLPQELEIIEKEVPSAVMQRLRSEGVDLFFPVFWRDNLYGVYFVKSTIATSAPGFRLLVANLGHSLSAAYHVRWHESKLEKLEHRGNEMEPPATVDVPREGTARPPLPILKLVRHAGSEALIPQLIETIQRQVGASRAVMVYEDRTAGGLLLAKSGTAERLDTPPREAFDRLLRTLETKRVDSLLAVGSEVSVWIDRLKVDGFRHVARFAPTQGRKGLLVLDGPQPASEIERLLTEIEEPTQLLFSNAELFDEMQELSYTDNLTGLSNQRYFRKRLREEIDRARRYNRSLALIIFDMDDLKSINDRHGHLAGDAVIQRLGPMLRSCIRAIDIVARYGGDEFCVIMPEADAAICSRFMERLHAKFSGNRFVIGELNVEIVCTISLGGAVFPDQAGTDDELIFAADMALLQAKARGRNQYLLYSQPVGREDGTGSDSRGF